MKRNLLGLLVLGSLALAQADLTPTGASIQNQASATYVDSAGQPRSATSNQVVTVEDSRSQTRIGIPNTQVLFSHQVTNTGNGTVAIGMFIKGSGAFFPQGPPYTCLEATGAAPGIYTSSGGCFGVGGALYRTFTPGAWSLERPDLLGGSR